MNQELTELRDWLCADGAPSVLLTAHNPNRDDWAPTTTRITLESVRALVTLLDRRGRESAAVDGGERDV